MSNIKLCNASTQFQYSTISGWKWICNACLINSHILYDQRIEPCQDGHSHLCECNHAIK